MPNSKAVLLIHREQAQTLLFLVRAGLKVVSVRRADHAESIPDEVAELVVDVRPGSDMLVRCDEDVALGELLGLRNGEVPDGGIR